MPSKSKKQAKFMRAVAHGWKPDRVKGPTRTVAREFVNADRRNEVNGYQFGGPAMYQGQAMNRSKLRGMFPQNTGPMQTTNPVGSPPRGGGLQQYSRSMPIDQGGVPWRGRDPRQRIPGPVGPRGPGGRGGGRGFGGRDPRAMPPQGGGGRGGLSQMMQQFMNQRQGQQGGGRSGLLGRFMNQQRPPMPPNKGPRIAPPPGKYPGGGNPNLGGRNPMMRGRSRFGGGAGRGATRYLR